MVHKQESPTWDQIAQWFPEFVQWVVQKHGPLPTGPASEDDYNRYKQEYDAEGRGEFST